MFKICCILTFSAARNISVEYFFSVLLGSCEKPYKMALVSVKRQYNVRKFRC